MKVGGDSLHVVGDPGSRCIVITGDDGKISAPSIVVRASDLVMKQIHPGLCDAPSVVFHRQGNDPAYERWRSELRTRFSDDDPLRFGGAIVTLSERNSPPLFGAGLIDALPDDAFLTLAAAQPAEIQGRVNRRKDGTIGRFGWKSQVSTLREFVMAACANELGLESPGHHQAASPLNAAKKADRLDLTQDECDSLIAYIRELPPPKSSIPSRPDLARAIANGRRLFESIGCAVCHVPRLGNIDGIYSDLLLHDMGEGLQSGASYYGDELDDTTSREWRTPPLWSFANSAPYLHDGRTSSLIEVVDLHGGQATTSASRFAKLSKQEQFDIYIFLYSLGSDPETEGNQAAEQTEAERAAEQLRIDAKAWAERTQFEANDEAQAKDQLKAGQNPERIDKPNSHHRVRPNHRPGGSKLPHRPSRRRAN